MKAFIAIHCPLIAFIPVNDHELALEQLFAIIDRVMAIKSQCHCNKINGYRWQLLAINCNQWLLNCNKRQLHELLQETISGN